MTVDDLPDDARREYEEARAARAEAEEQLRRAQRKRREMAPVWRRLGIGAYTDTWGDELEKALTLRGTR